MIAMKQQRLKFLSAMLLCYCATMIAEERTQDQYEMVRQQIAARCTITAEQATQELQALLLQSGWVADTSSRCGGYFRPAARYHPVDNGKDKTVDFDADQTSMIALKGVSYLSGNVNIRYKNQYLSADKACLQKMAPYGQVAYAAGHVLFAQGDFLILADSVLWYLRGGEYLQRAFFKLDRPGKGVGAAWGKAEAAWSETPHEMVFNDVAFSYCSVEKPDWVLESSYLSLDTQERQGFAGNAFLRLFGTRIMYLPLFSFALDSSRKSGFLYPRTSYSDEGGWSIKIPYYWNLAPNYDLTTTIMSYVKRGLGLWADGRFLTEQSQGNIRYFSLYDDEAFSAFRTSMTDSYASSTDANTITMRNDLLDAQSQRQFLFYTQQYRYSQNSLWKWSYAWLSDDYMRDDFATIRKWLPMRKLPRSIVGEIDHTAFYARLALQDDKVLQTLGYTPIQGVFSALPELTMATQYRPENYPDYTLDHQVHLLRFAPADGVLPSDTEDTNVRGVRLLYTPVLHYSRFHGASANQLSTGSHTLWYNWHDDTKKTDHDHFMFVPWARIAHSTDFTWTRPKWLQIARPRLQYTYVPYRNQDGLLILDSALPADTYEQLFRINRFSGYDRLGDSNAITLAVENSWVDAKTGQKRFSFNVGKNYAFTYHRVCLSNDCDEDIQSHDHWSPWQVKAAAAYRDISSSIIVSLENKLDKSDSAYLDLQYQREHTKLKGYYNYVRYLDLYPMNVEHNHLIGGDVNTDINEAWSFYGNVQYSATTEDVFGYTAGFKYHSCCFDTTFGWEHRYKGVDGNGKQLHQNSVIFKFYFAGIGNHL